MWNLVDSSERIAIELEESLTRKLRDIFYPRLHLSIALLALPNGSLEKSSEITRNPSLACSCGIMFLCAVDRETPPLVLLDTAV